MTAQIFAALLTTVRPTVVTNAELILNPFIEPPSSSLSLTQLYDNGRKAVQQTKLACSLKETGILLEERFVQKRLP